MTGVFYMITTNVHGGRQFLCDRDRSSGAGWSDPIVIDQDVFDPSLDVPMSTAKSITRAAAISMTRMSSRRRSTLKQGNF